MGLNNVSLQYIVLFFIVASVMTATSTVAADSKISKVNAGYLKKMNPPADTVAVGQWQAV